MLNLKIKIMKKILLTIAVVLFGFIGNAQTEKGSWLIETNTNFGAGHAANTGFYLSSSDGTTVWSIGGEAGYFLADDLALKVGLGYTDTSFDSAFSYKVGAKYYVESKIPVQLDLSGNAQDGVSPMWLGVQGGYAIFLGENVSIEPGLRYNYGIGDAEDVNLFQLNVGFALHL